MSCWVYVCGVVPISLPQFGIMAAVSGGCRGIAIPEPGSDVGRFEAAGAELVLPSLAGFDVPAFVSSHRPPSASS